mmetsp:Transcript_1863/g.4467  ORF Transcript_1863/g.4467 Transcript_1863/m.4467 type:complete len:225 (+) Transcript_1863:51-725(+)|eukprot:CAMPEP_0116843630 /NCGR_PEP_ID=MMETSP0418-20121206/12197_1 /TAXON_ID=1158023 /ORGANISM="Astrosyne radiata, Strain 13vi08-1A" /LENGTH=224 /DNA_ID=CAMNT_0004474409 /DNA_START=35 /DNA_END=709 /DNA_ORIENTATION=+
MTTTIHDTAGMIFDVSNNATALVVGMISKARMNQTRNDLAVPHAGVLLWFSRISPLDQITKGQGLNGGNLGSFSSRCCQKVPLLGQFRRSLEIDLDTGLTGLGLGGLIVHLALQYLLLTFGLANVFDAHVDTLLNDAAVDQFVDPNADGRLGDVEDDSRPTVVTLVGHALVDGRIGKDIDVIAHLDLHQVLRQVDRSVLTEFLGKHVTRTRPCSIRVRHDGIEI